MREIKVSGGAAIYPPLCTDFTIDLQCVTLVCALCECALMSK